MPGFKGEIAGHSLPFKATQHYRGTPTLALLTPNAAMFQDKVDAGSVVGGLFAPDAAEGKKKKRKKDAEDGATPKKKKSPKKK